LRKIRPLQPVMTYQLASVFIAFLTSSSCSRSCNHATKLTTLCKCFFLIQESQTQEMMYVQLVLQNIVVHKSRQWHLDFPRYLLYTVTAYFFSFIPIAMFGCFWSIFPLCLVCLHFCTLCVMRKPNSRRML